MKKTIIWYVLTLLLTAFSNDDTTAEIFAFTKESDTVLRLLQPDDQAEDQTMYLDYNYQSDGGTCVFKGVDS